MKTVVTLLLLFFSLGFSKVAVCQIDSALLVKTEKQIASDRKDVEKLDRKIDKKEKKADRIERKAEKREKKRDKKMKKIRQREEKLDKIKKDGAK